MKKITIIAVLLLVTLGKTYAESLNDLVKDFSKYQKAQQYSKIMTTSDKIITLFLEKNDFGNAEKFSTQIRDATHPKLSKYGYYLLGKTYHDAYSKFKKNELLDKAITNYKASVYSEVTAALASLKLEALRKDSGLDEYEFLAKVERLGKNVETDRVLRASYKHIQHGRWELVKRYLDKKIIDVNARLSSDGTTLLHMAVWYNKGDIVKELINKYGANFDVKDKEGDTPLLYAKHKKYDSIVRYLKNR